MSIVLLLVVSISATPVSALDLCPICDMPPAYETCSGDYCTATAFLPCDQENCKTYTVIYYYTAGMCNLGHFVCYTGQHHHFENHYNPNCIYDGYVCMY